MRFCCCFAYKILTYCHSHYSMEVTMILLCTSQQPTNHVGHYVVFLLYFLYDNYDLTIMRSVLDVYKLLIWCVDSDTNFVVLWVSIYPHQSLNISQGMMVYLCPPYCYAGPFATSTWTDSLFYHLKYNQGLFWLLIWIWHYGYHWSA